MSEQGMRGRLCVRMTTTLSLGVAALLISGCAFNRVFIPEVHKVHRGESLTSIAAAYDLNWRHLARWNGIDPPYTIRVGQRLSLDPFPPLNYDRMRQQRRAVRQQRQQRKPSPRSTVTALPSGGGLSVAPLPTPQSVSGAQRAPAGSASNAPARQRMPTAGPAFTESGAFGPTASVPAEPAHATSVAQNGDADAPGDTAAIAANSDEQLAPAATTPPPLVSAAGWRWPLATSVLNSHTAKPTRHGMNLRGIKGTPVYAARAGQVVYSGVGLQGFGQLVIIKHDDNYLSAYGYVENVRVEEGGRIASGEHIADMGLGPGRQAMLHFEIRHDGEPIEPKSVLPQR